MTPVQAAFRQWSLGYSGCIGGDPGTPQHPAIWVCGIEPGAAHAAHPRARAIAVQPARAARPPAGYDDWRSNLAHGFTRRIVKLLTTMHGEPVLSYREFAQQRQPFTRGSPGFFRLNLYPIGFPDTNPAHWNPMLARTTGFKSKADYLEWCDANRLPVMRRRIHRYRPAAVVCLGKSYATQFQNAFADTEAFFTQETIAGKRLTWYRNQQGTIVAVVPFLTSPSGLQSDTAIEAFGKRLKSITTEAIC